MRNGIPVAKPGDKLYANPEYAPGFHKQGGAIPGSTFMLQGHRRTELGRPLSLPPGFKSKTYLEVTAEQRLRHEEDSVRSLQDWERTVLKESDPKYVDPDEDER
eukprot:GILI01002350.1.p1 GENE.GILI01002350.1~~GILI01002350.1.p1  ORF type:complete len:115 (+),score=34.84 GILI01002350.1:36-347(+)